MNPKYVTVVKQDLDKLLVTKFITPMEQATWLSPIVVVLKKNGNFKICVDFKKLNTAMKKDIYPLPFMEEIFYMVVVSRPFGFMTKIRGMER